MESWVYLFSQFTPEALLFESLAICLLIATYSAYWILRRKKGQAFASADFGQHMDRAMVDGQALQNQLAQLIAVAGNKLGGASSPEPSFRAAPASDGAADPVLVQKVSLLEGELAKKDKSMQVLATEKERLVSELEAAQAAKGAEGASGGSNDADLSELQEKIRVLEGKLSEYSVIEDDLANLKRLQQENAELKAKLGQGGQGGKTKPAEATAKPIGEAEEFKKPAAASGAQKAENFESLVDDVEESLKEKKTPEKKAAKPDRKADDAPQGQLDTNDADLVKEFEKMLKS